MIQLYLWQQDYLLVFSLLQEDEFQEFSKKVEVGSVYSGKVVEIR